MFRRRFDTTVGIWSGRRRALAACSGGAATRTPSTITLDWAYCNPTSLVLRQSAGSRKS